MPALVISLDFELFWGVAEARSLASYRGNLEGVWKAVPRLLSLFRRYKLRATWATVGMVMCRDYRHWMETRPVTVPSYLRHSCSAYEYGELARDYPKLFFARPLVEQILATGDQELASHTYSHFYCGEQGATVAQFADDIRCANEIAKELGVSFRSVVFPRNQIESEYFAPLRSLGIAAYRGNPAHWLYRQGHRTPGGHAGRVLRLADAWVPLSGAQVAHPTVEHGLVNIPGSLFLRPCSSHLRAFEGLRLRRIKEAMTAAAMSDAICHIWWHPHNFGTNLDQNLVFLESLLQHYAYLRDSHGMRSLTIADAAAPFIETL